MPKKNMSICAFLTIAVIVLLTMSTFISSVSASNWTLVCVDGNEFPGPDIKALYYKIEGEMLYLKVTFHDVISSIYDFNVGILLDIDSDPNTGFDSERWFSNTGLGAEYFILVGYGIWLEEGYYAGMYRYRNRVNFYSSPIFPDYINIDYSGNMFIVGFRLDKFIGLGDVVRVTVFDSGPYGRWWWTSDLCPDTGNALMKIRLTLVSASGISTGGLTFLTIDGDSGLLRVYAYPGLNDGLSYQFRLKVLSIYEADGFMIIDILINYNFTGGDNWLPGKIVVDKLNNMVYLFGPINMIGHL